MKETFTAPQLELITFAAEDIITTSDVTNAGTHPDDGKDWSPLTPVG